MNEKNIRYEDSNILKHGLVVNWPLACVRNAIRKASVEHDPLFWILCVHSWMAEAGSWVMHYSHTSIIAQFAITPRRPDQFSPNDSDPITHSHWAKCVGWWCKMSPASGLVPFVLLSVMANMKRNGKCFVTRVHLLYLLKCLMKFYQVALYKLDNNSKLWHNQGDFVRTSNWNMPLNKHV